MLITFLVNEMRILRDRLLVVRYAASSPGSRIDPRVHFKIASGCRLRLGSGIIMGAYSVISVERDVLAIDDEPVTLSIGDNTYIGELNNIRAAGVTVIGKNCLISQGVSLIGSNHSHDLGASISQQASRTDRLGIVLGDDVWVGTNATILAGVTIGDGAVVAAGSVVTKNVAPYSIVAGVPAKLLKMRA